MATIKNKTFPSKAAALKNAEALEKRGEISSRDYDRLKQKLGGHGMGGAGTYDAGKKIDAEQRRNANPGRK